MHILSFDCANRSLAVCYLEFNENLRTDLQSALATKNPEACIKAIENFAVIKLLEVEDLTKGKKCTTEERALLLKQYLTKLDASIKKTNTVLDYVLVEYQMSANDKSRCVSQQLVYHYSNANLVPQVRIVGPTLKNKLKFAENLGHGTFMEKYASKYTANKNHSKANFLYFLKTTEQEQFIKTIKKKNLDDAADSFTQIFGWLHYSWRRK